MNHPFTSALQPVAVFSLTSSLHDPATVDEATRQFLSTLAVNYEWHGDDYQSYGSHSLDVIFVRTGGTEGLFRQLLPQLQRQSGRPFRLLTSGQSNSLAASMEILSFLRQQGLKGEIIHGNPAYVNRRLTVLAAVGEAVGGLRGTRLGIIGPPSDWLISSHVDAAVPQRALGITLEEIGIGELVEAVGNVRDDNDAWLEGLSETTEAVRKAVPGAMKIYHALRAIVERHRLNGFTLRCFDLLTALKNTGCAALARLNGEGIVAGCEGDVPAMLTMHVAQHLTGMTGFQANPATIDPATGELLMAHCTIPLNLVERYELDTHFESGIGVAIRGYMKEGAVTIFKLSPDLRRHFVAEGTLVRNQAEPNLCRTQQVIRLADKSQAAYFLTRPIGNHHIVLPGHHGDLLRAFLQETIAEE